MQKSSSPVSIYSTSAVRFSTIHVKSVVRIILSFVLDSSVAIRVAAPTIVKSL